MSGLKLRDIVNKMESTAKKEIPKECTYCGSDFLEITHDFQSKRCFVKCTYCKAQGPIANNLDECILLWNNEEQQQ